MSLAIDVRYLSLISSRLPKFINKGKNLYNFRCPICGDSQKYKNKARGFCYPKKNNLFYKCHNCDYSTTFPKLLERIDTSLYKEYILERFKAGELGKANYEKPKLNLNPVNRIKQKIANETLFNLDRVDQLEPLHPAKMYICQRQIPFKHWNKFYFTDNFKKVVDQAVPDHEFKLIEEPRVIIPFYDTDDNLIAFQGRSLIGNTKLRYITIKIQKDSPKIFGLDRVDFNLPFYILEGPIDSLFLPNAIAVGDSSFPSYLKNGIFVPDNEPRKKLSVKKIKKAIDLGYKVVLFPSTVKGKDLNEMVINGYNVVELVEQNIYHGLEAQVKFSQWSKI